MKLKLQGCKPRSCAHHRKSQYSPQYTSYMWDTVRSTLSSFSKDYQGVLQICNIFSYSMPAVGLPHSLVTGIQLGATIRAPQSQLDGADFTYQCSALSPSALVLGTSCLVCGKSTDVQILQPTNGTELTIPCFDGLHLNTHTSFFPSQFWIPHVLNHVIHWCHFHSQPYIQLYLVQVRGRVDVDRWGSPFQQSTKLVHTYNTLTGHLYHGLPEETEERVRGDVEEGTGWDQSGPQYYGR